MKKKHWKILVAAVIMLLGMCFSMPSLASWPSVSQSNPLKANGWQRKEYVIYSDPSLEQKVTKLPYGECDVIAIGEKAAQISYGKGKTGWIPLKSLIYNTEYPHQVSFANAYLTMYMRPSVTASYITVPQFSGGVTVSARGSWVQVIFKVGARHYLGWMKATTHQSLVRHSMETTTQPLANGTYTILPRNAESRALTYHAGDNRFTADNNKNSQKQKYTLRYVSGGNYLITPLGRKKNLADKGGVTAIDDSSQMWKLTRIGGYFYIRSAQSGRALRYTSGKVSAGAFRKLKAQQWRLVKTTEAPTKENSVVFSQYDPKWGGSTYCDGPSRRTISTSGCGVMVLTNAVYALNGEFISPTKIAKFSQSRGHYFYNQGTADTLYKDFAGKYGKMYHFKHSGKTYSLNTVRKHLKKGSVAMALVPGHYVALVGYRSSDDHFLVLDSAVYGKRPTTIYGDWVPSSYLKRGTLWCEYFHILSKR